MIMMIIMTMIRELESMMINLSESELIIIPESMMIIIRAIIKLSEPIVAENLSILGVNKLPELVIMTITIIIIASESISPTCVGTIKIVPERIVTAKSSIAKAQVKAIRIVLERIATTKVFDSESAIESDKNSTGTDRDSK